MPNERPTFSAPGGGSTSVSTTAVETAVSMVGEESLDYDMYSMSADYDSMLDASAASSSASTSSAPIVTSSDKPGLMLNTLLEIFSIRLY